MAETATTTRNRWRTCSWTLPCKHPRCFSRVGYLLRSNQITFSESHHPHFLRLFLAKECLPISRASQPGLPFGNLAKSSRFLRLSTVPLMKGPKPVSMRLWVTVCNTVHICNSRHFSSCLPLSLPHSLERVFKVETVGDCYVAAAGLPEPRKDHAVAMVRFARDCITMMRGLAKDLETTLG